MGSGLESTIQTFFYMVGYERLSIKSVRESYESMNKKIKTMVYGFAIFISFFQTISASQYAPNVYYAKPFNDDPFASNASITFSAGYANEAYDANGNTVPFLEQYGPEDFLERFIYPELGQDNTDSAGQGKISGQYHFKQYRFSYSQNIVHQLFFGAVMVIQDITISNITPQFLPSEMPLSPDQISYLEQLDAILPKSINQAGMYNMNIYFGYSENLTHFNHINSFSGMLLVDISTPQSMSNNNESIFQFPCAANYFFGYPVVGAINVEINDLFSFGFSGLVTPFQQITKTIPVNDPTTDNHLLFSDSTQAMIHQQPFFAGTIYAALKNPDSKYTGTIAYSYSQYLHTVITPIGASEFATVYAHRSIFQSGYSLGSFVVQLDIDCTTKLNKLAPIISLFFSVPVAGEYFKKTYLFGGGCNLKISYDF